MSSPHQLTEADVIALYTKLLEAWNHRDADGFAGLFAKTGNSVGFDGSQMNGRDQIGSELRSIFADHVTATYVAKIREVKEIGSTASLLRAVAGMIPPGKTELMPSSNAIQSLVACLEEGQARIALFHNTPAAFHGRPQLTEELTRELSEVYQAGRLVEVT